MELAREQIPAALAAIAAWRADRDAGPVCPSCQARGLTIIDRSARPYSEWYALKCVTCGLEANVQIPLSGPGG
jgi:hypothetical protein